MTDELLPLPTAAVADALVRDGQTLRSAPATIRRLMHGEPIAGPAVPVRHFGSVDVFLEALADAPVGSVLVIDNGGRDDEACIGDLSVAEFKLAGVAGVVLWGFHRDESALRQIGLPVWSLGARPAGPSLARHRELDYLAWAEVGDDRVTPTDVVVADDDGVLFVDGATWPEVSLRAAEIMTTEAAQAGSIGAGTSLREQLAFDEFLARRHEDPTYTFRRHLAERGGAIET
jgi:4-hydroxy-4-methyl-2-oxoglutarate aldolase